MKDKMRLKSSRLSIFAVSRVERTFECLEQSRSKMAFFAAFIGIG